MERLRRADMNNRLRQYWFQHYWWITIIVAVALAIVILNRGGDDAFGLAATCVGVALSVIYFVQKQKLEEIALFEQLFTEFNHR